MYVEVKPPHNSSVDDCFLCGNSFPRPSECRDCAVPPGLSRTLLSPLLGGPFLISPRRRQSATPEIPRACRCETHSPPSTRASSLPQGLLRGEVPTGLGFDPIRPAGLPASGFSCISTHRVSIRPSHPSLDAVSRLAPTSRLVSFPSAHRSRPADHAVPGAPSSVSHECPHGLIVCHRWHPRLLAAPDCSAITAFLGIGCPSLADSCFHANSPPTVYQPVGARPKRSLLKTPQSLVLPTPGTVDSLTFFFVFLPALHTKPCRATPSTAPRGNGDPFALSAT